MAKHLFIFGLLVIGTTILSCSKKNEHGEGSAKEESDKWEEMDQFHMVMAETFHPYKDSSNLEPVKSHVSDLVTAAKKWVDSPIPEKVNNDDVKAKLTQLQAETLVLETTVKSGPDSLIANSLTKLHNTFHEIQEHWYVHGENEEKEEHEHH